MIFHKIAGSVKNRAAIGFPGDDSRFAFTFNCKLINDMNLDDLVKLWITKFGRTPRVSNTLGGRSKVTIEVGAFDNTNTDRIKITNSGGTYLVLTDIVHKQLFARWTELKQRKNHMAGANYTDPNFRSDAGRIMAPYIPIIYRDLDQVYRDLDL